MSFNGCIECGNMDISKMVRFPRPDRGGRNAYICYSHLVKSRKVQASPVVGALPKTKDINTELFISVTPADEVQLAALRAQMEKRQGSIHVATHNPACRAVIAHDAIRPSMKAPCKLVCETLPALGFNKVNGITAVFTFGGGMYTATYNSKDFMPELKSNPHEWLLQAEHDLCKKLHIANRSALSTGTRKK